MSRSIAALGLIGVVGLVSALKPEPGSAALPAGAVNGNSVGDYAFDFAAFDQDGNTISLYQYRGTYIVLDFCAEWCLPCRQLTPALDLTTSELNSTGLPEVTLDVLLQDARSLPSTVASAQSWARQLHSGGMPVLNVGGAANSPALTQMLDYDAAAGQSEGGFPTLVILSPTLKILSVNVGTPVGVDQMPAFVNGIIQTDLTSDPSSGLAEATVLTERRKDSATPFPLKKGIGDDIQKTLERVQSDIANGRTDLACAQTAALRLAASGATCSISNSKHCPNETKELDPTYAAQLTELVGDVREALQCPDRGE
jgi:thiol-disulfide isomerase/thioredoxin